MYTIYFEEDFTYDSVHWFEDFESKDQLIARIQKLREAKQDSVTFKVLEFISDGETSERVETKAITPLRKVEVVTDVKFKLSDKDFSRIVNDIKCNDENYHLCEYCDTECDCKDIEYCCGCGCEEFGKY
jgi:hypothetical protein